MPCHASKCIKKFLDDNPFEVIDWPGNSLDLNLMGNCSNFMKEKLKTKDTRPVSKLIQEIKMLWTTGLSNESLQASVILCPDISSRCWL
jgi:hypothetical protein